MPESTKHDSVHGVPKGGGHGGLIAGAILMLLLAGGLVVWKLNSGDKEPEVITEQAPLAPAEPAPEVAVDAAPPPPPEEEEEKEEPKPAQAGVGQPKGPAGCSGECAGTMTPGLQSALASRGSLARSCYNNALRTNPNLEGKMTINVRLSPTGTVCSASVSNNALGDQAVAACAVAKFRAGSFPPPEGGCINAAVPLNFTPQK